MSIRGLLMDLQKDGITLASLRNELDAVDAKVVKNKSEKTVKNK